MDLIKRIFHTLRGRTIPGDLPPDEFKILVEDHNFIESRYLHYRNVEFLDFRECSERSCSEWLHKVIYGCDLAKCPPELQEKK